MTKRRSSPRPFGFTLIEMAVVVSITSVLFALSATTIITLLRLERQFAADTALQRTLGRLAVRLRDDAHAATASRCSDDCQFDLANGTTVRYSFQSPSIVREAKRGDAVEHRDSFVLDRTVQVEFSLESASQRRLVVLRLSRPGPLQRAPSFTADGPVEFAAAVGLDVHTTSSTLSADAASRPDGREGAP